MEVDEEIKGVDPRDSNFNRGRLGGRARVTMDEERVLRGR